MTERTDQPKITDFFKPVSPEVHELATNRDRVQDLERRLKETELLKARLEKENDNLRAKNAELRKKSRLDSAADSSIPRTTKESDVKAKSEKLEDRITNPNTPVKDSPAKPKTSSSHRRKSSGKETKQSSKTKLKKNEKEASKSKEVPNGKTKVTVTDSSAKVGPKSTPNSEKKKRIVIAGDSIVKDVKGWLMSRQKSIEVYSFSGADTEDMEHFLQPLINKKPDQIILHIGTNDVSNGVTVKQATDQLMALCEKIKAHGIKCAFSSITLRGDELWKVARAVNNSIRNKTDGSDIDYIDNNNIEARHLNRSNLHLNQLAGNMINYIKNVSI